MDMNESPAAFVENFLNAHKIPEPDGRRLFEYDLDDYEYRELRATLQHYGDPIHLRQRVDAYGQLVGEEPFWDEEAKRTMAAFVLYGAQWFARNEPPPRRTWARLLAGIMWRHDNYVELYPAIIRGLEWWRTTAIRTPSKTLYFDTLAYQGGLSVTGLVVIEYELNSESSDTAYYAPRFAPEGFDAGGIRVKKQVPGPAPKRIAATFDFGAE